MNTPESDTPRKTPEQIAKEETSRLQWHCNMPMDTITESLFQRMVLHAIKTYAAQSQEQVAELTKERDALKASNVHLADSNNRRRQEIDTLCAELEAETLLEKSEDGYIKIIKLPKTSRITDVLVREIVCEHNELIQLRAELEALTNQRDVAVQNGINMAERVENSLMGAVIKAARCSWDAAELSALRDSINQASKDKHGASGLCCQLRYQEKLRADKAEAELQQLRDNKAVQIVLAAQEGKEIQHNHNGEWISISIDDFNLVDILATPRLYRIAPEPSQPAPERSDEKCATQENHVGKMQSEPNTVASNAPATFNPATGAEPEHCSTCHGMKNVYKDACIQSLSVKPCPQCTTPAPTPNR
jgi:hypothetical protein